MSTLEHLYPERVFYYFKQIAAIPHGSGNTKAISDYLVKFAKEHALTWYQDEANNVVLVKSAIFKVEQHLEFFHFHNALFQVVEILL